MKLSLTLGQSPKYQSRIMFLIHESFLSYNCSKFGMIQNIVEVQHV